MKYKNKTNGKIVEVIKEEDAIIWFRIGEVTIPVSKKRFNKIYVKIDK